MAISFCRWQMWGSEGMVNWPTVNTSELGTNFSFCYTASTSTGNFHICYYINCVRVLQRKRINRLYRDVYKRRFIIEIGSCSYGGREVPWSAIRKMENQGSQWCNSVFIQRPENWRAGGVAPGLDPNNSEWGALISKGRRRWRSQHPKRVNPPLPPIFVLFGPSTDWMIPTCICEANLLSLVFPFKY